jgi:hypothetical protein
MSDDNKIDPEQLFESVSSARLAFFDVLMKRFKMEYEDVDRLWRMAFHCGRMTQVYEGKKEFNAFQKRLSKKLGIELTGAALLVSLLVGCSDAKSSGRPQAERIFTDQPGYVCFVVRDEDGRAVGGNCVRE